MAIIGPPNAGKSSLLNAFWECNGDRDADRGTTRDYNEESCEIAAFSAFWIDTAGIRDSQDVVESMGIQRSRGLPPPLT